MRTLEDDLARAEQAHGHLCHGIVLGVRMARMACAELDIEDPAGYRDLVVYVEMQPVDVEVPVQDRPGRPGIKAVCERCGERIFDGRECVTEGRILCRPCAGAAYYSLPTDSPRVVGGSRRG